MSVLAKFIEYTVLRVDTSLLEVRRLCEEAIQYQFAAVCVPPFFVRDAKRTLGDSSRIRVVTVVGFPMGYSAIAAKSEEIKRAIDEGADEIDAVVNISAVKSGNWNHVYHDIDSIARAVHMRGQTTKLILECGLHTKDDLQRMCELANDAKIAWLKTGTGMHQQPATVEMVRQLRSIAPEHMKIKAAGGIRTAEAAQALLDAGADRIGCSVLLA
jgi:deoxyribose-phosphate aldolase